MATVVLDHVSKRFSASVAAVDDVSLQIDDREFLVLVGPSGCGKSTTLRLIAGLETCDEGEIRIGSRRVNETSAKDRDLAMVFQNYALYPHMTVYRNLSFGLELRYGGGFGERVLRRIFRPGLAVEFSRQRAGISRRVLQVAQRLGIDHLLTRRPHQLSGGERQRVALGRAIVREPAAFLFDEPLSNLDAKLRMEMRVELKRLHRELGATMVYVTHDQTEAMTLGDRVAVMHRGRIAQVGTPQAIYHEPCHRFVAEFIGAQPINLIEGVVVDSAAGRRFRSHSGSVSFLLEASLAPRLGPILLGIRPEHVGLGRVENVTLGSGVDRVVAGRAVVTANEWLGDATVVHLRCEGPHEVHLQARLAGAENVVEGQVVACEFSCSHLLWFDPTSGDRLRKE
jgi:multiple sugar transport system ATP-binding protein